MEKKKLFFFYKNVFFFITCFIESSQCFCDQILFLEKSFLIIFYGKLILFIFCKITLFYLIWKFLIWKKRKLTFDPNNDAPVIATNEMGMINFFLFKVFNCEELKRSNFLKFLVFENIFIFFFNFIKKKK